MSVWDNLRPPKGGLIKLTVYLCKFPKKWRVDNLDSKIQKWSYKPKCNALVGVFGVILDPEGWSYKINCVFM